MEQNELSRVEQNKYGSATSLLILCYFPAYSLLIFISTVTARCL